MVVALVLPLAWLGCTTEPAPAPSFSLQSGDFAATGSFRERGWNLYDEFVVTNVSANGNYITEIEMDFGTSSDDAFLDAWPRGYGLGMGYPFQTDDEEDVGLTGWFNINDGARTVRFTFGKFSPGKSIRFRLDIDGNMAGPYREVVNGAGFAGTTVRVGFASDGLAVASSHVSGQFSETGSMTAGF